jgi:hypothetical protein
MELIMEAVELQALLDGTINTRTISSIMEVWPEVMGHVKGTSVVGKTIQYDSGSISIVNGKLVVTELP